MRELKTGKYYVHKAARGMALLYRRCFPAGTDMVMSYDYGTLSSANDAINRILSDNSPCMIARYGNTELLTVSNYLGVHGGSHNFLKYMKGEIPPWWWDSKRRHMMGNNAGFFPLDDKSVEKYCRLMLEDSGQLDLLGSWLKEERFVMDIIRDVPKVELLHLEPFFAANPWTGALKGKKVLVVHPFADLIESQYNKREVLFDNPDILPSFNLQTLKAVQSIGGNGAEGFETWFDALEWMEQEIDKRDFDIALIACGAYGFPLAAHVKRIGKKAFHLGGVIQILFGIKGARWDSPDYQGGKYQKLFNEHWVRAGAGLRPANASDVEGGCYW